MKCGKEEGKKCVKSQKLSSCFKKGSFYAIYWNWTSTWCVSGCSVRM